MYVSGRVDIFDMVNIDLFTVVALNMMVLKLGYTSKGLYALAGEENVHCLGTLVRSFKLIEVYIEHGVTALDSYLRAPLFRAILKEITDEPGSIAANRTEKCFDDLDLNLNEPVNLNVSQVETQSELPVSEEPDVGRTQEPILAEVSTQEPIVAEVSTQEPIVAEVSTEVPIVEEVGTQEFSVEDVVLEDYVSSGEDAEQGNGQEDESAPTDGQFFYDDEGIDTTYETEYDVQSSEDAGTDDDDDVDEDFLVDEENEIVEPDVDVYLFGISMDFPFDNIGVTNLVSDDVLKGEDVDVINADGFDSDPGNDEEKNYRKRRLAELRTELKGVINASDQWKYSFYSGQKFTTLKEAKDRVYLHSIESRRNLKLYKNDGVRIRARCDGKVPVFKMSQGTGPTGPNRGMEAGPNAHDKGDLCPWVLEIKHCTYKLLSEKIFEQVRVNPNILVKAVQDQLQRELEVQISISKAFRTKAKAEREIRGDHRIYICLGALKLGFRACKRDLLGLDGAFMKGPFLGQVLVAVGLDLNNGIYPLAYADGLKLKDTPVITLLEYIREYYMKRIVNVQGVINKCTGPLSPTATRIMEIKVQWNGINKYQVSGSLGDQWLVLLKGLSAAAGVKCAGGLGGASQVNETRNANGREMGDGVPTRSSAAGDASEWSFLYSKNRNLFSESLCL
ncbi:hypothetical protein Tco_1108423 [Tanacetum coccineum]